MLGSGASTTEVTLLSAIPFGAAAVFHICNALHSQVVQMGRDCGHSSSARLQGFRVPSGVQCMPSRAVLGGLKWALAYADMLPPALLPYPPVLQYTGERRWHIALPWLFGGVFMAVLPTVTDTGKHVSVAAGC